MVFKLPQDALCRVEGEVYRPVVIDGIEAMLLFTDTLLMDCLHIPKRRPALRDHLERLQVTGVRGDVDDVGKLDKLCKSRTGLPGLFQTDLSKRGRGICDIEPDMCPDLPSHSLKLRRGPG